MKSKNLKKLAALCLLTAGLAGPISTSAQDNTAFVLSPPFADMLRSATFGESVINKNNMLFVIDRQYRSDGKVMNGCNIGYGALYTYTKSTNGLWVRNQKLKHIGGVNQSGVEAAENTTTTGNTTPTTSLKWNSLENGFGESGMDVSGNLLVVGTPREDFNRWGPNFKGHAGAVYLYRRTSPTASYSLVKTIFDPSPWNQTRFAAGGVSLNGNYIVALTQKIDQFATPGYISLFSLTENNVNQVSRINLPSTWTETYIHGTTENNIMVVATKVNGVSAIYLYKVVNGSLQQFNPAANVNLSGYAIENDLVSVNTNYFVVKYKNLTTGKPKVRVFIVGSDGSAFPFEVILPADLENKTVKGMSVWGNTANPLIVEARTLAVTFKDPAGIEAPVIAYFKFKESSVSFEYKTRMTLPSQYAANTSFKYGEKLLVTDSEVIISDAFNRTFDSADDGTNQQCSEFKSSGVVFVHNRSNFENAAGGGFRLDESMNTESEETLAPNPADGDFVDYISHAAVKEVSATDVAGRSFMLTADGNRINISGLESGLYILKVKTDAGVSTKKLNVR